MGEGWGDDGGVGVSVCRGGAGRGLRGPGPWGAASTPLPSPRESQLQFGGRGRPFAPNLPEGLVWGEHRYSKRAAAVKKTEPGERPHRPSGPLQFQRRAPELMRFLTKNTNLG